MNYFKSIMLTAFALFALAACDTDDLRDDVDNLKDRVESLEAQVSLLNDNMTAIKRLLEGGQTITEVTNTDGTYKLKLSNGETISLTQGSKGEVAYPEITVNDEGQWVVNGEVLMQNGTPVQAVGTPGKDGIAPKFRITDEGSFWQVSYDNGTSWEDVLDTDGQKVSAVSDGSGGSSADSFFEEVYVDSTGEFFVVKLKGQTEAISIPIVKDLLCEITEPETGMKNGYWEIGYGKTATTTVKVKGENIIVTAPAGWVATVSEADETTNVATLSITAPANAMSTRATADNGSDVTVQVNKGASWAVAKIQVKAIEVVDSYYELYNAGGTIEINGIKIQKDGADGYGEATLITSESESKEISQAGVYFIKPGVEITYTGTGTLDNLVLIGDNAEQKVKCIVSKPIILGTASAKGAFIMNINMDASTLANYVFSITGNLSHLAFSNSEFSVYEARNLVNCAADNAGVSENISIIKSLVKFNVTKDWTASRVLNFTKGLTCTSVTFENNVVYPSTIEYTINGCLLFAQGQNLDSKVIISHNTFINFISSSQSLVRANVNNDVTFSNLLFFYNANFGNKNATLINVGDGAIGTLTFADNIRYNNGTSVINLNPFGGTAAPGYPNTVVPLAEANPFDGGTFDLANGIFIPNAEYAEYGATNLYRLTYEKSNINHMYHPPRRTLLVRRTG